MLSVEQAARFGESEFDFISTWGMHKETLLKIILLFFELLVSDAD